MLTKEKFLKDKISLHIKSPESNEEYVKLIQKLIDLGWKTYNNISAKTFSHYTWIYLPHIDEEYFKIHPRFTPDGQKEIKVSDILENNQFEVGKWSVGSYVVFLHDIRQYKKGEIDVIIKAPDGGNMALKRDNMVSSEREGADLKWFATLSEAEVFSKSLLTPKTLTVDDLVKGEIYFVEYSSGGQYINLSSGKGAVNCYIDVKSKKYWKNTNCGGASYYRIATPEEKKWLLTCIKQDKFVPQSELDKYDEDGNLIETKSTFEFNKWYKSNNADGLFFIQSENTGYGFRSNHKNYWFTRTPDMGNWDLAGLIPSSTEEIQERLLSFAKEKYPIGARFKCIRYNKEFTVTNPNYMDNNNGLKPGNDSTIWIGVKEQCSGEIFDGKGKWAEIISKPEPKVNRNVYYEVSNQEQYEEILYWLKENDEKVSGGFNVLDNWVFVYYHPKAKLWSLDRVKPNLPKAEFTFKSKQSIKVNTSFEEACPFPSFGGFSVDLSDVTTLIFSEQVICPTIEETSTNEKVKVQLINVPRI